jgi:peptidoglycan/xylan/chitin deacetylase (PgdA/CDA1 family)
MSTAIVTTSWDDGHPLDLRLSEMLAEYGVPATFYFPVERAKRGCMTGDQMREIARSFDIGGHTYHHVNLRRVPVEQAKMEVIDGKQAIEERIGKEVKSFCYPYGEHNRKLIEIVRRAGFIGARTTRCLNRVVRDPFRMGPTVHARDWWFGPYLKDVPASRDIGLFLFMLRGNLLFKGWDDVALGTLDYVLDHGGVWHLYGHSWEIDSNGDWARLRAVLKEVGAQSERGVWMDNTRLIGACRDGLLWRS